MTPTDAQPAKKLPPTHPAVRGAKKDAKAIKRAERRKAKKKAAGTAVAIDDPRRRREIATQQAAQPSSMALMLLEAARDKTVDAEKARAMFDLYKDVQAHDAKTAFTKAFIALQKELPTIDKDGKIEHADSKGDGKARQKSLYSTYPNLMDVVKPLLDKYGFGLGSWIEPGEGGKIDVVTQLDHEQGHHRMSRFPLTAETSGSKNNIQGWGSSQSYGMRYNAIGLLNIVSKAPSDRDIDGRPNTDNVKRAKDGFVEAEPIEVLSEEQLADLNRKMVACKVPLDKVLKHYAIEKLSDLPANLLSAAMKACDDYAENQKRVAEQRSDFPGDRISTGGPGGAYRR